MAIYDAIADRIPDGKNAMATFKGAPYDLGRAPAWLQDKAREWWTQTFSEARVLYVQALTTQKQSHVTGMLVSSVSSHRRAFREAETKNRRRWASSKSD